MCPRPRTLWLSAVTKHTPCWAEKQKVFPSFLLTDTYRNILAVQRVAYADMLQKTKVSIDC